MQGLPQVQMQTHTPGIPVVQPATVYYDPDRVRESTRKVQIFVIFFKCYIQLI
jgi:hypothetical protein